MTRHRTSQIEVRPPKAADEQRHTKLRGTRSRAVAIPSDTSSESEPEVETATPKTETRSMRVNSTAPPANIDKRTVSQSVPIPDLTGGFDSPQTLGAPTPLKIYDPSKQMQDLFARLQKMEDRFESSSDANRKVGYFITFHMISDFLNSRNLSVKLQFQLLTHLQFTRVSQGSQQTRV